MASACVICLFITKPLNAGGRERQPKFDGAGYFFMNNTMPVTEHQHYNFGGFETSVHISPCLPGLEDIAHNFGKSFFKPIIICDANTRPFAEKIMGGANTPLCMLESGEQNKNWRSAETILRCACDNGIGRDGIFIGVGGGVLTDLCAFAASVYMRGCSLALVATTLLAMADASIGGKTGFDLAGIKNLVGTFYPARHVYMPLESLASLPLPELKSGMAEIIKTAVLAGEAENDSLLDTLCASAASSMLNGRHAELAAFISSAVKLKGGIAEEDPKETGSRRILLNLGHTFGHALESAAGLGVISHGEAVAWGMARSCELGQNLGICPPGRAEKIRSLLASCGYETHAPHPLADSASIMHAIDNDKKKRAGSLFFIVPGEKSAVPVVIESRDTIVKLINGV